eukprot:11186205-Lingulodinium_polyedra.AAC.1
MECAIVRLASRCGSDMSIRASAQRFTGSAKAAPKQQHQSSAQAAPKQFFKQFPNSFQAVFKQSQAVFKQFSSSCQAVFK